jgi:cytochrome c peroxidase
MQLWFSKIASLTLSGVFAAVLLVSGPVADVSLAAESTDIPPASQLAPGLSATRVLLTRDASGVLASVSTGDAVADTDNPFFRSLGTNGRSCVTCHMPNQAWTITPGDVQQRFSATGGTDPIFRLVDGANSPNADVSSLAARRRAYSMLLSKGLIRVGVGVPANAEFELVRVDDPYGFASASELSLFRRPLPSTNLPFINTTMWDGRETLHKILPTNTPAQNRAALEFDLGDQANSATLGHAQATRRLTAAEQQQIVDFEMALFTAQALDNDAGPLQLFGASGGAVAVARQPFFVGINDLVVDKSTHPPTVEPPSDGMTLFASWGSPGHTRDQAAVARGEALFNSKAFTISGVAGLNDGLGLPSFRGTCATCHNTPNVGNHSVAAPLNIGIADASRRTPDLPLYTLRNRSTGELRQSTDPGRALITGQWADVGKFKGPVLRGLAARAPYFHNGSASTLSDVVDFYNNRFSINLTPAQRADLAAFLRSL